MVEGAPEKRAGRRRCSQPKPASKSAERDGQQRAGDTAAPRPRHADFEQPQRRRRAAAYEAASERDACGSLGVPARSGRSRREASIGMMVSATISDTPSE